MDLGTLQQVNMNPQGVGESGQLLQELAKLYTLATNDHDDPYPWSGIYHVRWDWRPEQPHRAPTASRTITPS